MKVLVVRPSGTEIVDVSDAILKTGSLKLLKPRIPVRGSLDDSKVGLEFEKEYFEIVKWHLGGGVIRFFFAQENMSTEERELVVGEWFGNVFDQAVNK